MSATYGLRPCPFCGGRAELMCTDIGNHADGSPWTTWAVWCVDDLNAEDSHGHFIDNYDSMDEAVAAWNGRAE